MTEAAVMVIGNSDGIGLALTRLLLERGYHVEGISRSPSPLQHAGYHHAVLDVAAPDYVEAMQPILERAGNLCAVVYCAGIGERTTPESLALDVRVFEVNLIGAVRTAQICIPFMLERAGGKFIVLSSQADCVVSHEATSYCASKAAMSSYFEGLGLQMRNSPLRICNVRFGFVATKMARSGYQPFRISAEFAARRLLRLIEGACPLRVTYPRRMALLVSFIAAIQRLRVAFA